MAVARRRVLAIGIDAAEPALLQRLVAAGRLPALAALAASRGWGRVESPAWLGSGAVWPTFFSATPPTTHGIHGEWQWDPEGMRVARPRLDRLTPFWAALAVAGRRVAVVDVPFARPTGVPGCAEILDWGPHDLPLGPPRASSPTLHRLMAGVGRHPFEAGVVDAAGSHDHAGLRRLATLCLAGVRQRGALAREVLRATDPDLALVVFHEIHRAAHFLWHTADPAHPDHPREAPGRGPAASPSAPGLLDVVVEVDREVGRLVEAAGPAVTVVVFSLHGMTAARGVPVLEPLLPALGLAQRLRPGARSARERAADLVLAAKRSLPAPLKRLYYRALPRRLTGRLAGSAMPLPAYDWGRTVAVSLPTDQHGWLRVNLAGREARGLVPAARYEETCDDLARRLAALTGTRGQPIVSRVLRTVPPGSPPPARLPDLVVHWGAAALEPPLALAVPPVSLPLLGMRFTGQHALEGFLLVRPGAGAATRIPEVIAAEALSRLLTP